MPAARVYPPTDRPAVEVLDDGAWRPGELHAWVPQRSGRGWDALAQWHTPGHLQRYQLVPATAVRARAFPAEG